MSWHVVSIISIFTVSLSDLHKLFCADYRFHQSCRPFKNEMGIQNTRVIFKSAIQTADSSHRCSEDTPTQQTEEREWVREQVLFRFYSHTPFTSQKSSKRKYKSPSSCSVSLNLCLFKLHKICSWLIIIF